MLNNKKKKKLAALNVPICHEPKIPAKINDMFGTPFRVISIHKV